VVSGTLTYGGTSQGAINAGSYTIIPSGLTAANYSITFGNGTLTISQASTLAVLSTSANPVLPGTNVTFTATISAGAGVLGTPSGNVRFLIDGVAYGAPVALAGGAASLTTALTHGTHVVRAEYAGNGNFAGATNTLNPNQIVNTPPVAGTNMMVAYKDTSVTAASSLLATGSTDADLDSISVVAVAAVSAKGGSVALTGNTVTYTPPTGYVGTDSFTFTISDTLGGTAIGTLIVDVKNGDVVLSGLTHSTAGFAFTGTGVPNRTYAVQATTDLTNWTTIQTVTADTDGHFTVVDSDSASLPGRFYRTVAQ
jgi:hypothetical protein